MERKTMLMEMNELIEASYMFIINTLTISAL